MAFDANLFVGNSEKNTIIFANYVKNCPCSFCKYNILCTNFESECGVYQIINSNLETLTCYEKLKNDEKYKYDIKPNVYPKNKFNNNIVDVVKYFLKLIELSKFKLLKIIASLALYEFLFNCQSFILANSKFYETCRNKLDEIVLNIDEFIEKKEHSYIDVFGEKNILQEFKDNYHLFFEKIKEIDIFINVGGKIHKAKINEFTTCESLREKLRKDLNLGFRKFNIGYKNKLINGDDRLYDKITNYEIPLYLV